MTDISNEHEFVESYMRYDSRYCDDQDWVGHDHADQYNNNSVCKERHRLRITGIVERAFAGCRCYPWYVGAVLWSVEIGPAVERRLSIRKDA